MIDEDPRVDWPPEVASATGPFVQGDLIERPGLFYLADLRQPVWKLSRAAAKDVEPEERGVEIVELDPDQGPAYGVITTQTCDLTEDDAKEPRKPWISVAPVYAVADESPLLEREEIYRFDPRGLPAGNWVADLRIEIPLEKSVLVERKPIEGFSTEHGYITFGNYLARRRGRPALASVFHEVISKPMNLLKKESNARRNQNRRVREKVHKLMLAIDDDKRLHPVAARLWVITNGEPDEETEDWFGEWWDRARLVAEEKGLQLHPIGWMDAQKADLTMYDDFVEMRNPM